MTTTANNNERKEFVNKIGFSGSFYKFLGEDIKIGYASNAQKELKEIEEQRNKAISKAQKEYEVKKAVVSFGISWNNIIFYNHSNKLCFNYSDCYKKFLPI